MLSTACPKPVPRKRVKAKARRGESAVVQQVRALCVLRDGDCRLGDPSLWLIFGPCGGESEWAHMPEKRRSKTRKMPPAERHSTLWTLQLCSDHHAKVDRRGPRPWISVAAASSRGADGPLAFQSGKHVHVETNR